MKLERNLQALSLQKREQIRLTEKLDAEELTAIESYLGDFNLLEEDEISDFIKDLTQRQAVDLLQTFSSLKRGTELVVLEDSNTKGETNVRESYSHTEGKARYLVNIGSSKLGGVGEVLYGYDLKINRRVGIKRIPKNKINGEQSKRLKLEAHLQASTEGKTIVNVYDLLTFIKSDDFEGYGMVMEFMNPADSPTLSEWVSEDNTLNTGYEIQGKKALPSEEIKKLLDDIVKAISLLDEKDVHHFDIKPANIFHTNYGSFKLADFGLSDQVVDQGESFGTPYYISPEKALGVGAGVQADLYSLTLSIYVLMLGENLFTGSSGVDVASSGLYDQDSKIKGNPLLRIYCHEQNLDLDQVEKFFIKALKTDQQNRFSSPEAYLEAALKAFSKLETPKKDNIDNNVSIPRRPDSSKNQEETTVPDRPEEPKRISKIQGLIRNFFSQN